MNVRWQRRKKKTDRTDDWLMTYADMITLLLCFFVIMAASSISQKTEAAKPETAQNVEVPAPEEKPIENNIYVAKVEDTIVTGLPALEPDEKTETIEPTDPKSELTAEKLPEPVQTQTTLPEIVDNLKAQGAANIEQKGDRITSLEINSAAFFDKGSASISPAGKTILHNVAGNLKAEEFKEYQITVEGHTDNTPINTAAFPSNWELSTSRAAAVVRFFLEEGIPAQKLRAAGYANTFPKLPNSDANGNAIPDNQAQNRRVVIKLEKIEKTT